MMPTLTGNFAFLQEEINEQGFAVVDHFFTEKETDKLRSLLELGDRDDHPLFRKTEDIFAIRQFLKVVPFAKSKIFNSKLCSFISALFGDEYFIVKSVYFDKPPLSNWFVAYHQDLTLSVKDKIIVPGFGPWTTKQNQFAVQLPLPILEDNFTIRIHLDDTSAENGALRVIPGSHLKGVFRAENIDPAVDKEVFCEVKKGGIMIMKPLLLHASHRTRNKERRRVIHIEFSRKLLPAGLNWAEKEHLMHSSSCKI